MRIKTRMDVIVRNTLKSDFQGIIDLCRRVYPGTPSWNVEQLASHLELFPDGQLVAVEKTTGQVVGMAASLIVLWDDYDMNTSWRDFTDGGYFRNHDPVWGRTLYGAEIMVDPKIQGCGIGSKLYRAREKIAKKFNLLRIRAGARLRDYHKHAEHMSAGEYVAKVVNKEIFDPTLTFQLRKNFQVVAVTSGYLRHDPESLGYAAVIEWINPEHRVIQRMDDTASFRAVAVG